MGRYPENTEAQSRPIPETKPWAAAVITLTGSGRSLRSVGTDTICASASDASINDVKPPPGPTSMKRLAPAQWALRTLSPNRTTARICRAQ
ncbi:Uncharacterised protein [Mycobacterium tuberculosis]|uniref:Uncharacterized protein n=1 Tax=Mycobacterium tuberculosis TaxID=1773 RepID=A0A0U0SUI4_MYCTX|nr:Uncharacterised protein [Mycobacterium tuberculosis]COX01660.1 Uncharacterised protein [Mycobacterium tuberculosis]